MQSTSAEFDIVDSQTFVSLLNPTIHTNQLRVSVDKWGSAMRQVPVS
jgi:hypothetical protein